MITSQNFTLGVIILHIISLIFYFAMMAENLYYTGDTEVSWKFL